MRQETTLVKWFITIGVPRIFVQGIRKLYITDTLYIDVTTFSENLDKISKVKMLEKQDTRCTFLYIVKFISTD